MDSEIWPHLSKPPITEAVFEVRVVGGPKIDALQALQAMVKAEYPIMQPKRNFQFPPESSEVKNEVIGYTFKNQENTQIVVFQRDLVSFSRLKPYTQWNILLPEFRRLWQLYTDQCKPKTAVRIASRFINVVEIPFSRVDLDTYFENFPSAPKELPQELAEFSVKLVVPFSAEGLWARVVQSSLPNVGSNVIRVLFDIDIFCNAQLGTADERIWETFEKIHGVKNRIFFNYLKDPAVAMFK